ncbi:MAG TPA: Vps62-related protein, partial [Dehalococcoidia bacterium]|nr:Vps62-related protein [Dehalococcoidia bacterium]
MRKALAAVHLLFLINLATIGFLVAEARSNPRANSTECTEGQTCQPASVTAVNSLDEQLANRYVPVVYMPVLDRPCVAGGSAYSPLPVDVVLSNPEVELRSAEDHGVIVEAPSSADLFEAGNETYFASYLDFPGNPLKPGCRFERDGLRFAAGYENVAYARIVRGDDDAGLVLQYWFFYYFNDWNNKHEGDWELVQLFFSTGDVRQALLDGPQSIGLSQHRSGEFAGWDEGKVQKEFGRPVVYVARGSHANYFSPGLYLGRGESGRGLGCDDASMSSRRVDLSAQLLPDRVRGPYDEFAWLAYKGYWGETEKPASEGSTAPTTKQTWLRPLNWQDQLKGSSVKLPTRGLVGPDASRAFCDAVALGSEFLLPLYHRLPPVSFLALGVVSAGLAGSFASTWYLAPRLRPLNVYQLLRVLRGAAGVYRRRAYVFVTIGLAAFPLSFILTPIEGLIREAASLLELTPLALAAGPAPVLLPLEGVDIVLAGVLVAAGTSLAMARATVPEIRLRDLLARLPSLLLARFLILLAGACLCLTFVGIPFAVRQMLRWAFLEQAVLLDGLSVRESMSASARLVDGRSIWLAGTLVCLASAAFIIAPLLGIGLMLGFKSLSPAYINLIAANVYAL